MEKKLSTPADSKDAAMGTVLGAFCGDAAGGVLEFLQGKIDPERVEKALRMPGGGQNFGLGPGQFTDDSELGMCILHGVLDSGLDLDINNIVKYYGKWYQSHPFGIVPLTLR